MTGFSDRKLKVRATEGLLRLEPFPNCRYGTLDGNRLTLSSVLSPSDVSSCLDVTKIRGRKDEIPPKNRIFRWDLGRTVLGVDTVILRPVRPDRDICREKTKDKGMTMRTTVSTTSGEWTII